MDFLILVSLWGVASVASEWGFSILEAGEQEWVGWVVKKPMEKVTLSLCLKIEMCVLDYSGMVAIHRCFPSN